MGSHMPRVPEPEAMDIAEEAEAYACADFAEVNAAFVNRLLYFVGKETSARCLDIGTGPADIPVRVLRAGLHWYITAADISGPMLAHAHEAVAHAGLDWGIHLVRVDAKGAPFPSDTFDIVVSNSILHHVADTHLFWSELKRVAKPRAFVLLRDLARPPDPEAARGIVDKYATQESTLLQEEYYRSLMAAFTPDEVRGQLADAGMGLLRVEMVSDRHYDVFGRIP